MEKFSKWRDAGTGIAPFLTPLPTASATSTPVAVKVIALPIAWILAGLRTLLICLLFILQVLLVDVLFGVCLIVPPLHSVLCRIVNGVLARTILFLLGFIWISPETISLRRSSRGAQATAFSPSRADLIISNSSSYIEVLYLSFRYNATFLLPVSSTGSKASSTEPALITSWRRVGLLAAILSVGRLPERSERGESLQEALRRARGPLAMFPECTASNNRALLRFGELLPSTHQNTKPIPIKVFVISFKYELPSQMSSTATVPIPSSSAINPLPHLFQLTMSPAVRSVTIKKLQPTESPKFSIHPGPKKEEWEALAESLAATGRWKRTGLDWESKQAFLQFRLKKSSS